jgi:hypothetical protein
VTLLFHLFLTQNKQYNINCDFDISTGLGATCNAQKLKGTVGSIIKEIDPLHFSMTIEMVVKEAFCVGIEVLLVFTNGHAL